jgi:ornithine cyclodeaminase/alanine dehydrogenase-like protein (mu-crystallin family)
VDTRLRVLGASDIDRAIDMSGAIDVMASAFGQVAKGRANVPQRLGLETDTGLVLAMPGFLPDDHALAIKIVTVFPENSRRGLPSIFGLVVVLDASTGAPLALIEGSRLTALRTGAASGLATKFMARSDAHTVALFGAGVQARTQLAAVRAVRDITEVRILSRRAESADRLVGELVGVNARVLHDAKQALRGADIVITATTSSTPLFAGADLGPGTHVTAIGAYAATMREVDSTTVKRARVVVDTRQGALAEAGDLIVPIREGVIRADHIVAELAEVVSGTVKGRTSSEEITLFKSVGHAAQDVALARRVLDVAIAQDIGVMVSL